MNEVSHTPNYHSNLFSTGKQPKKDWKLGGNDDAIWTDKYGYKVNFDGKVTTPKGVIYYMYLNRNTEFSGSETETKKPITPKQAHDMLAYSNKYGTIKKAKTIILKLNPRKMEPCDACAAGESNQTPPLKKSEHRPATNKGECMSFECMSFECMRY